MCGRTCMTLEPSTIIASCNTNNVKYQHNEDKSKQNVNKKTSSEISTNSSIKFEYKTLFNLGRSYEPSHNITPGELSPIIVSAKHFDDDAECSDRLLIPALWGVIPVKHQGDYKKHGLTTNNVRMETCRTSPMYKRLLESGRRCVVPIEGYYEWQRSEGPSSSKPVYFLHSEQKKGFKFSDRNTCQDSTPNLMYLAGLFDVWHDEFKNSIFSFSVLTFESDNHLSWLHHRTPAILESENQIVRWLNFSEYDFESALKVIKPPTNVHFYQVTNHVNSNKNKSELCIKPL